MPLPQTSKLPASSLRDHDRQVGKALVPLLSAQPVSDAGKDQGKEGFGPLIGLKVGYAL